MFNGKETVFDGKLIRFGDYRSWCQCTDCGDVRARILNGRIDVVDLKFCARCGNPASYKTFIGARVWEVTKPHKYFFWKEESTKFLGIHLFGTPMTIENIVTIERN